MVQGWFFPWRADSKREDNQKYCFFNNILSVHYQYTIRQVDVSEIVISGTTKFAGNLINLVEVFEVVDVNTPFYPFYVTAKVKTELESYIKSASVLVVKD